MASKWMESLLARDYGRIILERSQQSQYPIFKGLDSASEQSDDSDRKMRPTPPPGRPSYGEPREGELDRLVRKVVRFQDDLCDQVRKTKKPSKEILEAFEREVQEDLEKIKGLISTVGGKCLAGLPQMDILLDFLTYYIFSRNEKIQKINQNVSQILINEGNAQEIFRLIFEKVLGNELIMQKIMDNKRNCLALYDVLKQCTEKSAIPTKDDIKSLLTRKVIAASEDQLATLQLMERLIKAYRDHGNTDPIEIYLNPMQDLYKVSEELRLAAGRVIRAAYGTLSNCLESKSLINTLLFIDSGMIDDDEAVIKEWFEKADFPVRHTFTAAKHQVTQNRHQMTKWFEYELSQKDYNFLQRSVLHLVAIFVHNDRILNIIPKEFIEEAKDRRDLHGCTPLHIAYLHGNQSAIMLLESNQTNVVTDYFRRTPESFRIPYDYCESDYTEYCQKITTTKSSVFATMKKMLILPIKECEAIEENFQKLFENMVPQGGLLNATVKIAGSVREKLKVGRFNEVDVQIRMESQPFDSEPFPGYSLHEYFVKRIAEIDWSQISLRPISVGSVNTPWKFIWEREGSYNGLMISVDVVPILIDLKNGGLTEHQQENLNLVVRNAPSHERLSFLKSDISYGLSSFITVCLHEWDILDNLTPGCRLGILIAKTLLEVLDQVSGNDQAFTKAPITSYVIKNAAFWILAGETPRPARNDIEERYGHLKQQLDFKETSPTWMTEEDLGRYGEEGRLWAETIFDAIHFMARDYREKFRSFLLREVVDRHSHSVDGLKSFIEWKEADKVYDVLDTCERCLERLRPSVFFNGRQTDN